MTGAKKLTDSVLYFGSNGGLAELGDFSQKDYLLLEVDESLIGQIENGMSLTIKGGDDPAILVTDSDSFMLRRAETSNLMLLVGEQEDNIQLENPSSSYASLVGDNVPAKCSKVLDSSNLFLEVTKMKPRFEMILDYLIPYRGPEDDKRLKRLNQPIPPKERLLEIAHASEKQLLSYLKQMNCVLIDDKWRMIDTAYLVNVLDLIQLSVEEMDLTMDSIIYSVIVECLQEHEIPESVLLHTLRIHAAQHQTLPDDEVFSLSNEKLCRTQGHGILQDLGKDSVALEDFMNSWKAKCPTFELDLSLLQGLYLLEADSFRKTISYFPRWSLPSKPNERFRELFKMKEQWSKSDILPYIEDLGDTPKDLDVIIFKFARVTKSGQQTFLTNKHASFN